MFTREIILSFVKAYLKLSRYRKGKIVELIQNRLNEYKKVFEQTINTLPSYIYTATIMINETLSKGNKIYVFGNGKNSIIAQYIASDIGENLSADAILMSDIANSDGFDKIYEKQIQSKTTKGDLLIGISTSGNSKNVLRGLSVGRNIGCKTIGMSGYDGGAFGEFCDINIVVPSDNVNHIHEIHLVIGDTFKS